MVPSLPFTWTVFAGTATYMKETQHVMFVFLHSGDEINNSPRPSGNEIPGSVVWCILTGHRKKKNISLLKK